MRSNTAFSPYPPPLWHSNDSREPSWTKDAKQTRARRKYAPPFLDLPYKFCTTRQHWYLVESSLEANGKHSFARQTPKHESVLVNFEIPDLVPNIFSRIKGKWSSSDEPGVETLYYLFQKMSGGLPIHKSMVKGVNNTYNLLFHFHSYVTTYQWYSPHNKDICLQQWS